MQLVHMDGIIIGKCQKGNGMLELKGIRSLSMKVIEKKMGCGHSGMGDEIWARTFQEGEGEYVPSRLEYEALKEAKEFNARKWGKYRHQILEIAVFKVNGW